MFPRPVRSFLTGVLVCGAALAALAGPLQPAASSARRQDASASPVPVYLTDFELFTSATLPPADVNAGDGSRKPPVRPAGTIFDSSDIPSVQARRLMDFFSDTLLQTFQKAGFKVAKQKGSRPTAGVQLRGVFAEADAQNHIRRAMLGGGVPGSKLLLYVGTFNLGRPDQPLYQLAVVQDTDSRYGPVITMNNYLPLVKFELSKNPSEDEVRRICSQIVQNLTILLDTNPSAFAQ